MAYTMLQATLIILFFLSTALTTSVVRVDAATQCDVSDVHVSQVKTGRVVGGRWPEYRVTFENRCPCGPVANVVVQCYGLDSAEPIDKKKIQVALGHLCVINDGDPLVKGSPMSFAYAPTKTPPQSFPVVNLFSMCPRAPHA